MISIALYNNKGGVGKTTSVINISQQLALKDKSVLVVDLDGQANCSRFFVSVHICTSFLNCAILARFSLLLIGTERGRLSPRSRSYLCSDLLPVFA